MTEGAARSWPKAELIETERLSLEPQRPSHADELVALLDDVMLHRFTGGAPATLEELRDTYRRQQRGSSADGTQGWLNWVARDRRTTVAVGTFQATLTSAAGTTTAEIAWVIGTPFQRRNLAAEGAAGMVGWLHAHDAQRLVAHIHPDHEASMRVARRLGLSPTAQVHDGEVRWESL